MRFFCDAMLLNRSASAVSMVSSSDGGRSISAGAGIGTAADVGIVVDGYVAPGWYVVDVDDDGGGAVADAEAEEEPEEYTLTTPLTAFRNVDAEDEWELVVEPLRTVV